MKKYLMILVAICIAIFLVYWAGVRVGVEKCSSNALLNSARVQSQIIMLKRDVDAETFSRGVGDIRRILRERYTIAG